MLLCCGGLYVVCAAVDRGGVSWRQDSCVRVRLLACFLPPPPEVCFFFLQYFNKVRTREVRQYQQHTRLFSGLLRLIASQTDPQLLSIEQACSWASTASTTKRNRPCTKRHSTYVPIRAQQRKAADRVGDIQHVVQIVPLAVFPMCLVRGSFFLLYL